MVPGLGGSQAGGGGVRPHLSRLLLGNALTARVHFPLKGQQAACPYIYRYAQKDKQY